MNQSRIVGALFTLLTLVITKTNAQDIELQQSINALQSEGGTESATEAPFDAANTPNFNYAAEQAKPAVVYVKSTFVTRRRQLRRAPNPFRRFFGDDFYSPFHGQQRARVAKGSGVILTPQGHIVTNAHVIKGAKKVEVQLSQGTTLKADVIGKDLKTDLALLKVEGSGFPHIKMGNSNELAIGEWVVAVGNPFNLASTVTAGIVSAKSRQVNVLKKDGAVESFIQTDAAVNPGNSGGALVNIEGELVGINTAIATPTGAYAGYAFAVPVNVVKKVANDLLNFGKVQWAYIGADISEPNNSNNQEFASKSSKGVMIDKVKENGAADKAGLSKGNVVLAIDGREVTNTSTFREVMATKRPGDEASLLVHQNGSKQEINVTLLNNQGTTSLIKKADSNILEVLGIEVEALSDQMKKRLPYGGVRITKINGGKVRKQTDLQSGFIIMAVDGQSVSSREALIEALEKKDGGVLLEGKYPGSPVIYYYAFGV